MWVAGALRHLTAVHGSVLHPRIPKKLERCWLWLPVLYAFLCPSEQFEGGIRSLSEVSRSALVVDRKPTPALSCCKGQGDIPAGPLLSSSQSCATAPWGRNYPVFCQSPSFKLGDFAATGPSVFPPGSLPPISPCLQKTHTIVFLEVVILGGREENGFYTWQ